MFDSGRLGSITSGNKVSGTSILIVSMSFSRVDVMLGSELKGIDYSGISISRGGPEVVPKVPDSVVVSSYASDDNQE